MPGDRFYVSFDGPASLAPVAGGDSNRPLNAVRFAVWSEYLSGRNSELTRAVEQLLTQPGGISEDDMSRLCDRFVLVPDEASNDAIDARLLRLIDEAKAVAQQAFDQLDGYYRHLQSIAAEIGSAPDSTGSSDPEFPERDSGRRQTLAATATARSLLLRELEERDGVRRD